MDEWMGWINVVVDWLVAGLIDWPNDVLIG